jgi:hypothetical protein
MSYIKFIRNCSKDISRKGGPRLLGPHSKERRIDEDGRTRDPLDSDSIDRIIDPKGDHDLRGLGSARCRRENIESVHDFWVAIIVGVPEVPGLEC